MGHYDNCRDGYCPKCGAAPGNIKNGLCDFCDKPKKQVLKKKRTPRNKKVKES